MDQIARFFAEVVNAVSNLMWGDLITLRFGDGKVVLGLPLLVLILVPAGIYFTIKTRFLQFRLLPEMIRTMLQKKTSDDKGSISGLQALVIATATRVGIGNLAGVAAAISFGGAGAVFWMWITALVGAATSFVESTLAQIYKEKDPLYGGYRGGPAYFIRRMRLIVQVREEDAFVKDCAAEADYVASDKRSHYTCNNKFSFLAIAFALSSLLCFSGISQIIGNSVTTSFENAFGISKNLTIIVLVIAAAAIVLRKNATVRVLDVIVPVMACMYLAITIFIVLKNITILPGMFGRIFSQAFNLQSAVGGGIGAVIMNGVKKGLFSNEAGCGSAPCAAAAADVEHPVKQGLIQALGVFIDTMVICSCTAFIVLLAPSQATQGLTGMDLLQAAMSHHVGAFGVVFIAIVLFLFSFSTFIGVLFYARCNVAFLFGDRMSAQVIYKVFALFMLFIGGIMNDYDLLWKVADLGIGLMTVFTMTALIPLSKQVFLSLKDYESTYLKKTISDVRQRRGAPLCPACSKGAAYHFPIRQDSDKF